MRIIASRTELILTLHAVRPHPPPDRDEFPQLPCRADRRRHRAGRVGGAQRRRQDQSDRGHLVSRAGTRSAARDARRRRLFRRRRIMGSVGGRRGCARARDLGHRDRAAGRGGRGDRAQMPRRSRAGRVGIRLRRPSARRRCARATGCSKMPAPMRTGSTPSSTKRPSSRSR